MSGSLTIGEWFGSPIDQALRMDPNARRIVTVARELLEGGELETILMRVLEAGRELTGARYAALGILNERRDGLARFLTSGLEQEEIAAIGDLPRGRGVLGELIRRPEALRLADVSAHPRSYGFPVGHPPMSSFLGAPILIRGTAYGNLYLTEKEGDAEFSDDDEETLVLLAECAAVAINHAQRFDELESRRDELERTVAALSATNEVHRALGGETDLDTVLELVAKRARALVMARTLVIALTDDDALRVAGLAGVAPAELKIGARLGVGAVSEQVMTDSRRHSFDSEIDRLRYERQGLGALGVPAAACLFVPLRLRGRNLGVLVALDRLEGGPEFTREDEELLSSFAVSAATAVHTAQAVGAERLRERDEATENERRRWARELHDETLQGLAAIRMALSSVRGDQEPAVRAAAEQAVGDLQAELDRLRAIIQDVRPSSLDDLGLLPAIEALVARHQITNPGPQLRLQSDLDYDAGRAETRLTAETETALYRIAQEALTNAIKHSGARRIEVGLAEIDGEVGVRVRDDGSGFDPAATTSGVGLVGMRERVDLLGGRLTVKSNPDGGTTVEARIPARHRPGPTVAAAS